MRRGKGAGGLKAKAAKEDFQVVPVERSNKRHRVLDAEGLAQGSQIDSSKKRGRDLMDDSFHRFVNSEGQWEVPEWFFDDERKHRKKPTPVTEMMVDEFKQKWKEINAHRARGRGQGQEEEEDDEEDDTCTRSRGIRALRGGAGDAQGADYEGVQTERPRREVKMPQRFTSFVMK
ncbi:unnamed protein product [Boreogadus saida]